MESPSGYGAARAYQLEMLDHSLERNVIVAMDTGSGKTRVSILRIRAQLERAGNKKFIWFLAPTVLLCTQQHNAITAEIPSINAKLVTGHDNVDTWDESTWEALLNGAQAIVSTYQVLLDALVHAFVDICNTSLLVFDEAHNCVRSSPGGKIMSQFYHFEKKRGGSIPAILGLTATPSIRADAKGLEALEELLDARCISPTMHRQQLLRYTNQPRLIAVRYQACPSFVETPSLASLKRECSSMDIMQDPHIISLRDQNTESSRRKLASMMESEKTWSRLQVNGFVRRACEVQRQLGPWASDLYIWQVKTRFLQSLERAERSAFSYTPEEKVYVANILRNINATEPSQSPVGLNSMSDKVGLLLRELLVVRENVVGLVFVKERVIADMLTKLLKSLTKLRDRYQFGCLVGTSNHQQRNKCLYEFRDSANLETLEQFRSHNINILVATSVLEEGIDVPACNLVICFDGPPTSKSFIQRRGRARKQKSDLILLLDTDESKIEQWICLEDEIAKLCQDSERKQKEREALEKAKEDVSLLFRVPDTGARLDQDNAKQHLEHFCQKVALGEFIDHRPEFITEVIGDGLGCHIKAEVRLPTCLPAQMRKFSSASAWVSETNAMKDAAFQALVALYHAGLINQHLLPYESAGAREVETRSAMVCVEPIHQPWRDVAMAWENEQTQWTYRIRLQGPIPSLFDEYSLTLPACLWPLPPVSVYMDHETAYQVYFSAPEAISAAESTATSDETSVLLALHFIHRWDIKEASHVIKISSDDSLAISGLGDCLFDPSCIHAAGRQYLIRDSSLSPGIYVETLQSKPPLETVRHPFKNYKDAPEEPYVHLSRWTRRIDFLHRPQDSSAQTLSMKPYACVVPISWARMDSIPIKHARFGMLIPSIIHHIETLLIAKELSETLLRPLHISDLTLLLEAITSKSANKPMSYDRLEFIGDSILKYCASVQAAAIHLHWPEGYLSLYKDRLVSNARLSRAAMETGLSRFILTTPFTGQKWRPLYNVDFLLGERPSLPERQLSTKVLADVVEALIAVAHTSGGMPSVIQFLRLFIRECNWSDPSHGREILFQTASLSIEGCAFLEPLEGLIGCKFSKKSLLLEGVTHGSYLPDTNHRNQGRLEFLGDAILDIIVVTKLASHVPKLPHHVMHMIKTAMVNKDFLAFLSLEEHEHPQAEDSKAQNRYPGANHGRLALWQFLRHASSGLISAQSETRRRHQEEREDILRTIHHGAIYPWALLLRLQAKKFFSDLLNLFSEQFG